MRRIVTTPSASKAVLVDSSGWVECLVAGPRARDFQPHLQNESALVVPTLVIYEVYKKLRRAPVTVLADLFLSTAYRCQIVPCDSAIAIAAADASLRHHLAMADAIIYATSQISQAQLVTADPAFKGLPGVTLI